MRTLAMMIVCGTALTSAAGQSGGSLYEDAQETLGRVANVAPNMWIDPSVDCGAKAIACLMRLYGREVDFAKLQDDLKPGVEGTSIARVRESLEARGLHTLSVRIGVEELARLRQPAILHVRASEKAPEANHFVVSLGADGDGKLVIINPSIATRSVDPVRLKEFWSGVAVVVSKQPVTLGSLLPLPAQAWYRNHLALGSMVVAAAGCIAAGLMIMKLRSRRIGGVVTTLERKSDQPTEKQ